MQVALACTHPQFRNICDQTFGFGIGIFQTRSKDKSAAQEHVAERKVDVSLYALFADHFRLNPNPDFLFETKHMVMSRPPSTVSASGGGGRDNVERA